MIRLAQSLYLPVVLGGDRHGCEPKAMLNLSNVATFEAFADEVRQKRRSEIVLIPHYFEPLRVRLLENAWHALSDASGELGRRHWMARVFIPDEKGVPRPLRDFTGTRIAHVIDRFRWVLGLLASPQLCPARMTFLGHEEGAL